MKCPFHPLRAGLPPLTERIAALPVDERGYPVPFFVSWIDGKPEFRAADGRKFRLCLEQQLCWVCGQPLGGFKTFTIGPMCAVTRTTAEPPSHKECSEWSVKGCPFLSKPKMVRREDEFTEAAKKHDMTAGIPIDRNPGVTCVWTTKKFKLFPDRDNKILIEVGEPESVSWWREGRVATRLEILESITTGLPLLRQYCDTAEDHAQLDKHLERTMKLLPK